MDDRPVIQIDILPTALASAGVPVQLELKVQGVKLVPPRGGAETATPSGLAGTKDAQLFNLAKDLGERTNVALAEPEKFKELAAAWDEWNKGNIPAIWGVGGAKGWEAN